MNKLPLSSRDRVLVLAVHPDDESLSAGGLIQHVMGRGAEVRVIFLTDGDNNPWPQRYVERRWNIAAADRARWGKRRESEAGEALARFGVPREAISFWHYPDQGITALLLGGGAELIEKLSHEIHQWRPTVIVAPSRCDLHPDHSALAVLLRFALARGSLDEIRPFHLLEYLVHSRGEEQPGEFLEIALSPDQIERKRKAILCHETQMALSRGRFLSFAQPTESFTVSTPSTTDDDRSRFVSAKFTGGSLCLEIARLAPKGTVFLAAETAERAVRLSVGLSSGSYAGVHDTVSGDFKGDARLVRGQTVDEIYLSAELFSTAKNLFVKVVSNRGFFDRAGWFQVRLEPAHFPASDAARDLPATAARVCCVIPCFNLAAVCGPIVRAAAGFAGHVIAVNDGSIDETDSVLRAVAAKCPNVEVLSLPQNCGKGIALLEAFRHAKKSMHFDVLVTLDGDGQHRPEDIPRLARAVAEGNHALVIGERLAREKMPLRSRFGNTLTARLMKLVHPDAPTDTQSGYRAFDRDFVLEIVEKIRGGRYETELEILLLALRQGRSIGLVGIPTVYLDGNRLSHFRPIIDSWRIYRTLFRWQLKGD